LTTATFTVTTLVVGAQATPTISAVYSGVTKNATLTVTVAPPALTSVTVLPTVVIGGTPSTGTATLTANAPAGGALVTLTSTNTAVATVPPNITIAAGTNSKQFSVTTVAVQADTVVTISGAYSGVNKTATLTVASGPPALSSVSVSPTSVIG